MRAMGIMLSLVIAVHLTAAGSAQEKKAPNNGNLVGKWESDPKNLLRWPGRTIEFTKDWKFNVFNSKGDNVVKDGTYDVEKGWITMKWITVKSKGKTNGLTWKNVVIGEELMQVDQDFGNFVLIYNFKRVK